MEGRVDAQGNIVLDDWDDEHVSAREKEELRVRKQRGLKADICAEERDKAYGLFDKDVEKMNAAELKKHTKEMDKAEEALMACYEKTDMVEEIVQKQEEVLECPVDFKAIEKLAKIQAQYDKAPKNESLSELVVSPINPASTRIEAHMPFGCGFDSLTNQFFAKRSFYCVDDVTCYSQGNSRTPKNIYRNRRIDGQANLYKGEVYNDNGNGRDSNRLGQGRYIPLGKGIYLESYRNNTGSLYYGLIFVPSSERFLAKACEIEKANGDAAEVEKLILQAESLDELKKLSSYLEKNRRKMSDAEISSLETQAFSLSDIVKGVTRSFRTPTITSACSPRSKK